MRTKNIFKRNLLKAFSLIMLASLSFGFSTAVQADVKFNKVDKHKSQQKHRRDYDRERYERGNTRQSKRGRYGQKHYDYNKDRYRSKKHSNRYSRNKYRHYDRHNEYRYKKNKHSRYYDRNYYDRKYNHYYSYRPRLTNCRYVYNRYGDRIKRCYPKRYSYSAHDNGYYHGRRFHDRYGAYYNSYHHGRYQRHHRGHHRSGYYYDTRAGEWIALAILFDRLLDH